MEQFCFPRVLCRGFSLKSCDCLESRKHVACFATRQQYGKATTLALLLQIVFEHRTKSLKSWKTRAPHCRASESPRPTLNSRTCPSTVQQKSRRRQRFEIEPYLVQDLKHWYVQTPRCGSLLSVSSIDSDVMTCQKGMLKYLVTCTHCSVKNGV